MNAAPLNSTNTHDDFFTALLNKKRRWSIMPLTKTDAVEGTHSTIAKALALRIMEIPVGNWIASTCNDIRDDGTLSATKESGLTQSSLALLLDNIKDEENHDAQLNIAEQQYQWAYEAYDINKSKIAAEAQQFLDRVNDLPDHPIVKAAVLERSVFFVLLPLLRFFGSTGMRSTAADISTDETVHVAAHTQVAKDLGLSYSKELGTLRYDVVAWMVQELAPNKAEVADDGRNSSDFWIAQSNSLLRNGRAEGLFQTSRARVLSFFEIDGRNSPTYN